jgi:predicted DsbA family dithiol-disulfide isomerase
VKIDVYSDIVCPWCYIGERRLDTALAIFEKGANVDVRFRPFQLDPGAPDTGTPLLAYLQRRYGPRAGAMTHQVGRTAAGEGITIDWNAALAANTRDAHRLLQLARAEYGAEVERGLVERLFDLHFTRGGDGADHAQLTAEAVAAGMDGARVTAYLASDEGQQEVSAAFDEARRRGITAVPTFVFNDTYAVQGPQPAAALLDVLEKVAAEEAAAAEPAAADDGACADGVCTT